VAPVLFRAVVTTRRRFDGKRDPGYLPRMPPTRLPRLRTLVVLLGLAANLIAAGAPLLHAFLHELHEAGEHHHHDEDHAALAWDTAPEGTDHPDSDVHPQALHDDARLIKRDAVLFPFPAVAVALPEPVESEIEYRTSEPPGSLRSRAPPPGDPARAPPLL
jgi:hypothetical protein